MNTPNKIYIVFHRTDDGSFQEVCATDNLDSAKEQAKNARQKQRIHSGDITWTPVAKSGATDIWIGYYIAFKENNYGDVIPIINSIKIQSINYVDGRFSK